MLGLKLNHVSKRGPRNFNKNFNSLRPRQNGRHFADDIFERIFLNESIWIPTKISLKFVAKGSINNIPVLVQIMAWRRPGDKPLSGPMMIRLPTHICVTRPQWVNVSGPLDFTIYYVMIWSAMLNNVKYPCTMIMKTRAFLTFFLTISIYGYSTSGEYPVIVWNFNIHILQNQGSRKSGEYFDFFLHQQHPSFDHLTPNVCITVVQSYRPNVYCYIILSKTSEHRFNIKTVVSRKPVLSLYWKSLYW